jgi:hypothetical protein
MMFRCLFLALLFPLSSWAQTSSTQLWSEYMVNYPFANRWNVEFAATYSTQFESPTWRSFDMQLSPEYSITPNIDVLGALYAAKTFQYQQISSSEFRQMIGTRIHFTPNRRVLTRLLFRYEFRTLNYEEAGTSESSNRTRIRAEALIPLNHKSMYDDKLWYCLTDLEAFIIFDQNVRERYANRYRYRLALGYRLSYTWRFEVMYTLQQSLNTIADSHTTNDNIFRLRVKHFLHKSKPSVSQGSN